MKRDMKKVLPVVALALGLSAGAANAMDNQGAALFGLSEVSGNGLLIAKDAADACGKGSCGSKKTTKDASHKCASSKCASDKCASDKCASDKGHGKDASHKCASDKCASNKCASHKH
jgi:uncharacterized low-complexity protein